MSSGSRIRVRYPSGNEALVVGEFLGPGYVADQGWCRVDMQTGWPAEIADDGKAVAVLVTELSIVNGRRMEPESVAILDPRAVCEDLKTGQILFSPSTSTPGTARWVCEWLAEHPEWPPEITPRSAQEFECDQCHAVRAKWRGYQGLAAGSAQEICRGCVRAMADRNEQVMADDPEMAANEILQHAAPMLRLMADHDLTVQEAADWLYGGVDPRKEQDITRFARDWPRGGE